MRVVLQRVARAAVRIGGRTSGEIGTGLLVLAAFAPDDDERRMRWMAEKLRGLRVFPDEDGRMNRDVAEAGGSLLVVSQFTLYGDASRGRRPSFVGAASPERARMLYDRFLEICGAVCAADGVPIESGEFGEMMDVELVNDGPVTLVVDR